ncbi:MAG: RNA polymerase sigma factor SigZ [Ktedonobacteraceae bacterium]|nr:RNA polymerase sigma factor SigZ [Ktedonobacteraceae bacterium]
MQTSTETEQVWQALHEPLRAFIRKRVADDESAEDLLQEVFLRVHTHIDTLHDRQKLESWIYQIARNLIIDHYRRRKIMVTLENATVQDMLLEEKIPEITDENVRARIAFAALAMATCLTEPYREALLLTDYQGLSQKELAERLGLSFSGAKSRVQRAREKLRQSLLDCCHFEFDRLGRVIDYRPRYRCCVE